MAPDEQKSRNDNLGSSYTKEALYQIWKKLVQ